MSLNGQGHRRVRRVAICRHVEKLLSIGLTFEKCATQYSRQRAAELGRLVLETVGGYAVSELGTRSQATLLSGAASREKPP